MCLERGEIVGLLGPNGAGKTTTFGMIMGLVKPTSGNIYVDDIIITNYKIYKRARLGIGYLSQEPSIFRNLTVEENIKAVLEYQNIPAKERKEKIESLLERIKIGHLARQPAYSLSGGEKRRLEIARCLACSPEFMLLDEPFSGVDPIAVSEIQEIIWDLKEMKIGMLITDHQVRETLEVTDRAYILSEGVILASGNANELTSNPLVKQVYLGQKFYVRESAEKTEEESQPRARKKSRLKKK